MAKREKVAKPVTIAELEALLNSEDERSIQIMPDGSIRTKRGRRPKIKPLTLKQNIGGEYAEAQR